MKTNRMVRTIRATAIILAVSIGAAWMPAASANCLNMSHQYSPTDEVDSTLHIAAKKGAVEIVEKLLNAGAKVSLVNSYGYTALHVAITAGHTAIVEVLLNAGANPNATAGRRCEKATPLHFAAYAGNVELVDILLAAGANPSAATKNGTTPMYWADRRGHVDVVLSLLNAGAAHE